METKKKALRGGIQKHKVRGYTQRWNHEEVTEIDIMKRISAKLGISWRMAYYHLLTAHKKMYRAARLIDLKKEDAF